MKLLLVLLCAVLSGCGVMLHGTMDRLEDGAGLPFGIETSHGTGRLEATDPATGEVFSGSYTGTYQGGGSSFGHYSGTASTWSGGLVMMSGNTSSFSPPTSATARGTLRGSRGTVIMIYLDIRPGLRPTGHGEGIDNKGRHYQVRF